MNLRALGLVVVLSSLSGCLIVSTPRASGDVTFLWTFDGQGCAMVPSVKNVKIDIGGQTLMNDGVFDCSTNGTAGIVLHDFKGGFYTYTIQGRDFNGTVLYTKSSSFTVDGSITVNADMTKVGGGGTYALLLWTFPPNSVASNPTCSQAGIDKVNVYIDGSTTPTVYTCSDGQTSAGIASPYLSTGSHTIYLSATNAAGFEYYALSSTLPISSSVTSQQYDLNWAVGGATVHWRLYNASVEQTCAVAGVTTVYVNFRDSQGTYVYGNNGDPQPCANTAIVYSFLKPGTYGVYLSATSSGGFVYESSRTSLPPVTVTAGTFTTMSDGPTIQVNRQ